MQVNNQINREQIQRALQSKKIISTSDLIVFIIGQVSKISMEDPVQELRMRIEGLQQPKGLDEVMLEEVKTIAQAISQKREGALLAQVERLVEGKVGDIVENMLEQKVRQAIQECSSNNTATTNQSQPHHNQSMLKRRRCSLKQNSQQLFNSTTVDNKSHQDFYYSRASNFNSNSTLTSLGSRPLLNFYKQLNNQFTSKHQLQDNFHSKEQQHYQQTFQTLFETNNQTQQYNRVRQMLHVQAMQIQQLKHSFYQVSKSIADKLNLQQIHQILSQFQTQVYQNIQHDKIKLQNLQFTLQKQIQSQFINLKKEAFNEINQKQQLFKSIQIINKDIVLLKKADEKKTSRYQKLKNSIKQLSQSIKPLHSSQLMFQTTLTTQRTQLQNYQRQNNNRNHQIAELLQQINQRLHCINRIDQMEENLKHVQSKLTIAQYETQFKTKNDQLVWEKELCNQLPELFKFEMYKSQIVISEKGTYQIQFVLIGLSVELNFTGYLCVQPSGVNFSKREIQFNSNQNSLTFLIQIEQKSFIGMKILHSENEILNRRDVKGLMKIQKVLIN